MYLYQKSALHINNFIPSCWDRTPMTTPNLNHVLSVVLDLSPWFISFTIFIIIYKYLGNFILLGSKITENGKCKPQNQKTLAPWKKSYGKPR